MLRPKRLRPDRTKRDRTWVFGELDELILGYLMKYRYLRGSSLHALIPQYHFNSINKRLNILFHARLIDKPEQQSQGYNSLNDTDIYEILPKGMERLRHEQPSATNLIRNFKVSNFEHSMMICDTLSSIEIGATRAGVRFLSQGEILAKATYEGNPLELACTISYGKYHEDTLAKPDAFFGLAYPQGGYSFFFVEAERGNPVEPTKVATPSVLKKLLAYKSVKKRETYLHLGIKQFFVLFLFETEGMMVKPKDLIERLYGKTTMFMLNTIPTQKYLLKAPKPKPELYDGLWLRGGLEPRSLEKVIQSTLD